MTTYTPGPATGAQTRPAPNDANLRTLILVRELRHSPDKVWQALTDPMQVREWAPFDVEGNLAKAGNTIKLTWVATGTPVEVKVKQADFPKLLEYGDIRWELEPSG